jgi:undecaprenyl-diphosphatase
MQEFIDVTLLALLQGVAEFLPISSSGHLVIGQHLLGMNPPGMRLDVFLHVGTLASIFVFYCRPITSILTGLFASDAARRREAWEYAAKIVVSALPAVVVYGLFKDPIEELFENARMVGALLMFTGAVLAGTRFLPRGQRPVSFLRALLMGCGQAIAILPGVSRSGMTLASARAGRVAPEAAAEFSFLMSAPLIAGDALLHICKAVKAAPKELVGEPSWGVVAWGAALAAVVGYFSLALLLRTLRGKGFWLFGPYCFTAGLLVVCFCK